jgi:hypothetical protein
MNQFIERKFIGLCFILQFSLSQSVYAEDLLPPILDYYPNCSYEVLDSTEVKVKTVIVPEVEVITQLLLNLREKAKSAGADALILKNRRMNNFRGTKIFYLSYKAEFIKKCNEPHTKNRKLTPVDQKGIETYGKELTKLRFELKLPKKVELNRPQITNAEVSVINGMYGIKIGADYQQVLDTFGDPSVELSIQPDELIVGYGRRHWLFFHENKLVNIQNKSPLLSQELINLIPLRDFFDKFPWKINNKLNRGSSLAEIQSMLKIKTSLNRDNQLIVNQLGNILTLDFSYIKNPNNNQKSYKLVGFSLKSDSYKTYILAPMEYEHSQYKTMNTVYSKVLEEEAIDWLDISHKLGEPIGRITLTKESQINIYNSHLFVKLSYSKLSSFYFAEQTLRSDSNMNLSDNLWNFGPFIQGSSIDQLREFIPESAFESDGIIEIDSDLYNLILSFDEINGKTSLYQAKIILY